jgi:hypothetical protein
MGNYAFGTAPGHAFLEAVIANCVKAQRDRDWVKPMMRGLPPFLRHEYLILNTTGPWLVSRTFAENKELAKQVSVLFPEDVCDLRTWNCFGDFGIHLGDSSWRSRRGSLRGRLVNYWETWNVKRLAKQLCCSPNKIQKPESSEPKVAT